MQKRKHRIGTELIEKSLTCVSIASKFVGGLSDDSKVWIWPSTVRFGEESAAHFPETRTLTVQSAKRCFNYQTL
jgi:hypothetical protein